MGRPCAGRDVNNTPFARKSPFAIRRNADRHLRRSRCVFSTDVCLWRTAKGDFLANGDLQQLSLREPPHQLPIRIEEVELRQLLANHPANLAEDAVLQFPL